MVKMSEKKIFKTRKGNRKVAIELFDKLYYCENFSISQIANDYNETYDNICDLKTESEIEKGICDKIKEEEYIKKMQDMIEKPKKVKFTVDEFDRLYYCENKSLYDISNIFNRSVDKIIEKQIISEFHKGLHDDNEHDDKRKIKNRIENTAYVYIRVSTPQQNPSFQIKEITDYCKDNNITILKIYEDNASGRNMKRNGLKNMLNDLDNNYCDVGNVITWRVDRLSRNTDDINFIVNKINAYGITFLTIDDKIYCKDAKLNFNLSIAAGFAQLESDTISSRVKAGIAAKKAKENKK